MSEWTFEDLKKWDKKINDIASSYGLDWYDIDYEMIDYYDMIGNISYTGLPSHYNHWSFGKNFERTRQLYNMGLEGLPYEMIINSDPSIAYLMRENDTAMHILTMAHCVGHSDFFKNNITFKHTDAANILSKFKRRAERIRNYTEDPSIGVDKVEKLLDDAHSIKYQCNLYLNVKKLSYEQQRKNLLEMIRNDKSKKLIDIDVDKIPIKPDYDVIEFIRDHGRNLEEWERDVLDIVVEETKYFIPQARTKIMNEGWASFWHYKILNELDLPQDYYLSFIKSHNQVIKPLVGNINPYHLGFNIFKRIFEKDGIEECLFVREVHNDESFIREYLDEELCRDLNLFTFSLKKKREMYTIDDIADEDGWKNIREDLIRNIGLNSIPKIYVDELIKQDHKLILKHDFDGRELDLDYAEKVFNHIKSLWRDPASLFTVIEDEPWEF